MDQATLQQQQRFRAERLQPKLTKVDVARLNVLETARSSLASTLTDAVKRLEKSTKIEVKISKDQLDELAPHLLRYTHTCHDYIKIKGLPSGFMELCERMDGWLKKLEGILGEMEKYGFSEEQAQMQKLILAIWKKSIPERHQGLWRKVSDSDRMNVKTIRDIVALRHRYRGTREKGPQDHFIHNFAVPAMTILAGQRNRFYYLAELYLHFYPEKHPENCTGKVALQQIADMLTDRVKNHKKKYGPAKGR